MLIRNKKIYIEDLVKSVIAPHNSDYRKVVADIIQNEHYSFFLENNMSIDLDNILFISDSVLGDKIEIPSHFFSEFSKYVKEDTVFDVKTINAYTILEKENLEKIIGNKRVPSLVIIGFINNIPEKAFRNITETLYGRTLLTFFGDDVVTSPEHGDYYADYLTSAMYKFETNYAEFKKSPHKKINSLVYKFRDKKTQTLTSIPSNSTNIDKSQTSIIDIDYLMDKLDSGFNVVVPRRLWCSINSKLTNLFGSSSTIKMDVGDTFYTRYPFVCKDIDDSILVIPAMSKVIINPMIHDARTKDGGKDIYLRDVTFIKPSGYKIDVRNVPINFSEYLSLFDPDEHIDNYDDFEDLPDMEQYELDPYTLSILPYRLFTCVEQKYIESQELLLFLETHESDIYVRNRNTWFESVSNAIEHIEIIHDIEFNI